MSRRGAARTVSLRSLLMVVLGGAVALLMPSLVVAAIDAPSTLVLAAIATAVAAVLASRCRLVAFVIPLQVTRPRDADHVITVLGGQATDPVHHPLRPRAPGLA